MEPKAIINFHAHLQRDAQTGDPVISRMSVPRYVEHCRSLGVRWACVSAGSLAWGSDPNGLVRECFERHPDALIGMVFIRLGKDDPEAVDRYHAEGFRGLKMINPAYPYDDPRAYDYYRRAERLGMPILFHTGWVAYNDVERRDYVNCAFMRPVCLDTICRNFPALNVVGAHLGNYWWEEAVYLSTKHDNLFFDLSGGSIRMKSLRFFRDAFSKGAVPNLESTDEVLDLAPFDHFVYGSDNPPPEVLLTFYRNLMTLLGVPDETQHRVYWSNAAKLLHIEN